MLLLIYNGIVALFWYWLVWIKCRYLVRWERDSQHPKPPMSPSRAIQVRHPTSQSFSQSGPCKSHRLVTIPGCNKKVSIAIYQVCNITNSKCIHCVVMTKFYIPSHECSLSVRWTGLKLDHVYIEEKKWGKQQQFSNDLCDILWHPPELFISKISTTFSALVNEFQIGIPHVRKRKLCAATLVVLVSMSFIFPACFDW